MSKLTHKSITRLSAIHTNNKPSTCSTLLGAVTCDSPSPTNKKTSRHVTATGLIKQSGFKGDKPSHSQTPVLSGITLANDS
jgi:hypothetical protein